MLTAEFRTEKVSDRITRIYAFSTELMYLVEGEESAVLLDSGSGLGFVKPLIDRLTDKPLKVLLTHGHVDHAMGASEFPVGTVYINKEDAYIYQKHCSWEFRKSGLGMMPGGELVTEEDFTPVVSIDEWQDLKEGDRGLIAQKGVQPGHGNIVYNQEHIWKN